MRDRWETLAAEGLEGWLGVPDRFQELVLLTKSSTNAQLRQKGPPPWLVVLQDYRLMRGRFGVRRVPTALCYLSSYHSAAKKDSLHW